MDEVEDLQKQCVRLLDSSGVTDWERSFLTNIRDKCQEFNYEFHPKQIEKVQKIEEAITQRVERGIE